MCVLSLIIGVFFHITIKQKKKQTLVRDVGGRIRIILI